MIWASYASRGKAERAIADERFGDGPWWIAYKTDRDPYPWALMTWKIGP